MFASLGGARAGRVREHSSIRMAVQNSGANILMKPHERRLSIRKLPEHLSYISLPSNNGGIVLDVSEGGLSFHSIAPMVADGPIPFRFAVDSANRISAVGELAWKDETGTTGGLRFTQLPNDTREHIRVWSGQARANVLDVPVAEQAIDSDAAPGNKTDLMPIVDIQVAEQARKVEVAPSRKPDLAAVLARRNPQPYKRQPAIYNRPANKLSMFPEKLNPRAEATAALPRHSASIKHPVAALALTIVLAFLVAIGISAFVSTTDAGEFLLQWGENIWSGFHSQSNLPATASPATSAPDSTNTPQQ